MCIIHMVTQVWLKLLGTLKLLQISVNDVTSLKYRLLAKLNNYWQPQAKVGETLSRAYSSCFCCI